MRMQDANAEQRERHQRELEHLRGYYLSLLEEVSAGLRSGMTIPTEENFNTEGNESLPAEKYDLRN